MKWIGQHIWKFISRFREDVYLEKDPGSSADTQILVRNSGTGKVTYNTSAGGGDDDQNLYETFIGDSGTTTASAIDDTLDIEGGTDIGTVASTDKVTINHGTISTPTANTSTASPAHGATFTTIDSLTTSATGHVTAVNTKTVTLPAEGDDMAFTVSATTDTNATTITDGDDLMFTAGAGITCETTADGTVTITNTVSDTDTTYSAGTLLDLATTTFNVDLTEATEAVIANGDYILFLDGGATGTHAKDSLADLVAVIAGTASSTGLSASSSVLSVSDLHPVGVDGSNNQVLTDAGDGTIISEAYSTFENTGNVSTLSLLSNQDTGDLFKIATTTHGATTITTIDDDAAVADLTLTVDGKITMTPADIAGDVFHLDADAAVNNITNIDVGVLDIDATSTATITTAGLTKFDCYGVEIENAGGTTALLIDNNHSKQHALHITGNNTFPKSGVQIDLDSLTTADGFVLQDTANNTSTRNSAYIFQEHIASTGATALKVQSDGGDVGVLIDKNCAAGSTATAAQDAVALHIDFDRFVAGSNTFNHNDIGIDLDVSSASDGDSSVKGMDIDVNGATDGSSTAYGINLDTRGADTNIGMSIATTGTGLEITEGSPMLKLAANANDYATFNVADTGDLAITTIGDGTTDSDITITADGKINLLSADIANPRIHGIVGGCGIPMGIMHYHFRGSCQGLVSKNWQYPEPISFDVNNGFRLTTDYGDTAIASGSFSGAEISDWFRAATFYVARDCVAVGMFGWQTCPGDNDYMDDIEIAIVAVTTTDGNVGGLSPGSGITVIATATVAAGESNDKTVHFSDVTNTRFSAGDLLIPFVKAPYDTNAGAGKIVVFNMVLEAYFEDEAC